MHDSGKKDKCQIEIPYGIVEYTAHFKQPILEAWTVPAFLVSVALKALEPFGFKLNGVEVKTHTEKLDDYALVFRRNPPGMSLTVGIGKLTLVAENLDWSDADTLLAAGRAGIEAILAKSKAEIQSQQVVLGMHIQLKTFPRQEVTAPLLSPIALRLLDGELKFPGIILQRENGTIVIDASLAYSNALFVRIIRQHPGDLSLEKLAEILRADEERLFDILSLEGGL